MNRPRIISAAGNSVFFQESHQFITIIAINRVQSISRLAAIQNLLFSEVTAQFAVITGSNARTVFQFLIENFQFLQQNGSLESIHTAGHSQDGRYHNGLPGSYREHGRT